MRRMDAHKALCYCYLVILTFFSSAARAQQPATLLDFPAIASPTAAPLRLLASTDEKHTNKDYLLLAPNEKRIAATVPGATTIYRLWFTASLPDQVSVSLEPLTPLVKAGQSAPVVGETHAKAFFSYNPMTVRDQCQLVVQNHAREENKFFFQIGYRRGSPPSASAPSLSVRTKQIEINYQGQEATAPLTEGSGVIAALSITLPANSMNTKDLAALRLRLRWDGESNPSVDAPLGWLFAQYFDAQPFRSAALTLKGTTFTLKFPLPYARGAQLSLLGASSSFKADVQAEYADLPPDKVPPYRFCAAAAVAKTEQGKPFTLLDVKGEGNLVGCTLGLQAAPVRRTPAFLEGNEIIEVDDGPSLTMEGTGTEDLFNSAWYFPDKPFAFRFHGLTFKGAEPQRISAYRLMITDRVPFQRRLKFTLQHGGRNNSPDAIYRAVTFWYQKEPRKVAPPPALPQGAVTAAEEAEASGAWQAGVGVAVVVALVLVFVALGRRGVDKRRKIK